MPWVRCSDWGCSCCCSGGIGARNEPLMVCSLTGFLLLTLQHDAMGWLLIIAPTTPLGGSPLLQLLEVTTARPTHSGHGYACVRACTLLRLSVCV